MTLTGPEAEIDAIAEAYWTVYDKVQLKDGDYTIAHTATVSPIDAQGRYVSALDFAEPREFKLAKLRQLVGQKPSSPFQQQKGAR